MSRSRLLLAIAFVCLMFGWLELSDQPLQQTAGVVLRQIEETTALPVTQMVESIERATGLKLPKPSNHAGSGKSVQQIMQEELAERQAIEQAQAQGKLVVTLQSITFQGATILGDRELSETVAKYLGVPMEYEQMLEIGMTVESYYRQNNYLARVILPPQDLSGGVLQLEVIESVISKIEVEQQLAQLPDTEAHVTELIARQQPVGEPLNTKKMERGLALANNVPGVSVQASLKEGKEAGDTELLLKMYQTRTMDSDITLDNAGSRSTGAIRLLASLNLINPNDLQDLFNLVGSSTEGSEYLRMAYSLPVGLDGWRMGANLSFMKYKTVAGEIGMVGAFGDAITKGLEWIYPLLRSDSTSATVTVTADDKQFKNTSAQGLLMSDYKAQVLSTQVAGFYRDLNPGGGSGTYLVQYANGNINLDGSLSKLSDNAKTEGRFDKIKTALTWQQPITTQTSAFVSYTAQLAGKNLDSSEKMQLGGMNGVRAYPTGEGSGSDGQLVQLELRHNLDDGFTLASFYDFGKIWQQHDANFPGAPQKNILTYHGFGASLGYTTPSGVTFKAIWARRRDGNPNPTQSGKDQDGTYDRNRYWLQMQVPF
jgi:hemolysin activation/secretion protein